MPRIKLPDGDVMSEREAATLIARYWQENKGVWPLFEASIHGARNRIVAQDVLALGALNARMTMGHMTTLWAAEERIRAGRLLRSVPTGPVEALGPHAVRAAAASLGQVADCLDAVPGMGATRVAKLIYRLRPALAPIWDDLVARYYGPYARRTWADWYERAMNDVRVNALALRAARSRLVVPYRGISLVRAWDVLLWSRQAF